MMCLTAGVYALYFGLWSSDADDRLAMGIVALPLMCASTGLLVAQGTKERTGTSTSPGLLEGIAAVIGLASGAFMVCHHLGWLS